MESGLVSEMITISSYKLEDLGGKLANQCYRFLGGVGREKNGGSFCRFVTASTPGRASVALGWGERGTVYKSSCSFLSREAWK